MNITRRMIPALVGLLGGALVAGATWADDVADLVAGLTNPTPATRAAAAQNAASVGVKALPAVAGQMASADPEVARIATIALENIVFHAGRPGADAERAAAAAALVPFLDAKNPENSRREALHLLSFVGRDAEVPAVAALLQDQTLADAARVALDRIPGDAAVQALLKALPGAPVELRGHIMISLAHKGATSAIPALRDQARSPDKAVVWPALEALATLGIPPNEAVPGPPGTSPEERTRYMSVLVKAGDACADHGDTAHAEKIYTSISAFHMRDSQACAALLGLARIRSEKLIEHALGYLGEPGIRATAITALTETDLPDLNDKLAKAQVQTSPPIRAAIFEILAARKAPNAQALLEAGLKDPSVEVRVTSARLLNQPAPVADLKEALVKGTPWTRERLANESLTRAAALRQSGDGDGARGLLEALIAASVGISYKVQAYTALGELANPASLAFLDAAIDQGWHAPGAADVADAAAKAYVAVATAGVAPDAAKQKLLSVLDKLPAESVPVVVEKLQALGVDTQALANRKGFITSWRLLGPLPNPDGSAFGKSFFDEKGALPETLECEGAKLQWKPATFEAPPVVNLAGQLAPNENVAAYAASQVVVAQPMDLVFLIGSDDGCEFWVNGEKVLGANGPRSYQVDQDKVPAKLTAGPNTVLIKVLQGGGDWQFSVRLADPTGKPLDLTSAPFTPTPPNK